MKVGIASEDRLKRIDDLHHISRPGDPAEPRPGPMPWRLDGRHQSDLLWIGIGIRIGIWIGIDAQALSDPIALRLQPPAPVFAAEKGHLDSGQRKFRCQIVAEGPSEHSFVDEIILLFLEYAQVARANQPRT